MRCPYCKGTNVWVHSAGELRILVCHDCSKSWLNATDVLEKQTDRLEAQNAELLAALEAVRDYHEGRGKYNFTGKTGVDYSDAAMMAWGEVYEQLKAAIKKARDDR